jgi:hypothetical protein
MSAQSAWAAECRKAGEQYNAQNMNLPACADNGAATVWGSESSSGSMGSTFNSNSNGSMGSTWGRPNSGPAVQNVGSGNSGSTGSGMQSGATGSANQSGVAVQGVGSGRAPASVGEGLPTQESQLANQPQTAPGGDANNYQNNGGDARWIK